ncbi:hypothetical protein HPB48_011820 [Haemaphysalis longicornis]|uniref:Uncharacterized protein n=1 Tax=Haemaphysalis longicornis TaxID=44386 RepID=A0A9J6GWC1_HAELO|nr:hypothetical protein HPB48_011820 [Haemaphysalis longicornis]
MPKSVEPDLPRLRRPEPTMTCTSVCPSAASAKADTLPQTRRARLDPRLRTWCGGGDGSGREPPTLRRRKVLHRTERKQLRRLIPKDTGAAAPSPGDAVVGARAAH